MTQDQPDQAHGPGHVVRGQTFPEDETEAPEAEQPGPVTRLKNAASALRGDKPDQTTPDEPAADPGAPDPNGPAHPAGEGAMNPTVAEGEMADPEYADAARPDRAGTARSPEAGSFNYRGDEQGMTETTRSEGPSMAAGYGSQAGTDTDQALAGSGPGVTSGGPADAGRADTAVAGSGPGGRHAAGAEDAGLRPGEATERLGDFGDIAFGNLLPDAEQYTGQWEQIQFRFVDDPQGSVTEAAQVISQMTAKLEAAIQERQRAIQERATALRGRWGEGSNADTETLRETLRMYRAFMDQLIEPAKQS